MKIHLIRHGQVNNPKGILYGRLEGFSLSEKGHIMAENTANALCETHKISALYCSPLLRTRQSIKPFENILGLKAKIDNRLIEAGNIFEGTNKKPSLKMALNPKLWKIIYNPFKPSWGENYKAIAERMISAMKDAYFNADPAKGDIVIVSHQSPIWITTRVINGKTAYHNPAKRRCHLSSVTSFIYDKQKDGFREIDYNDFWGQKYRSTIAETQNGDRGSV